MLPDQRAEKIFELLSLYQAKTKDDLTEKSEKERVRQSCLILCNEVIRTIPRTDNNQRNYWFLIKETIEKK
jgi:hypothetical protein